MRLPFPSAAPAARILRSLGLLILAVLVVVLPAAGARRPKPVPCDDGRFLIAGGPALVTGATAVADAVTLANRTLTIDSGCGPAAAKTKAGRKGTRVKARWATCGELRRARFAGRIASPACTTFTGKFRAKKRKAVSFTAERSRCGDGQIDPGNGEACEGSGVCDPGRHCVAASCACEHDATTTTIIGATTTTTLQTSVCGNAVHETGEACEVLASPSGCGAEQQCEVVADACECQPIPTTIGRKVSFTAAPPVDLGSFSLPNTPGGAPVIMRAPNVELTLDLLRADPVLALGRCARWITECVAPPARRLDDCVRSAPACTTAQPWLEAAPCCPSGCFPIYESRRRGGESSLLAFRETFFTDGSCIPGLSALRSLP